MNIFYHENTKTFHLTNGQISYLMKVLPNGCLGQLYFGRALHDRENFDPLLETKHRPMFLRETSCFLWSTVSRSTQFTVLQISVILP